MSYAVSAALQKAVFAQLEAEPALVSLIGDAIYDTAPPGEVPDLYVMLGEETVRDRSDGIQSGVKGVADIF